MLESTQLPESKDMALNAPKGPSSADDLPIWEQPKLEEVSEQVMAQPYIRFT